MKIVTIKIPSLFSFKACLKFLERSKNECLFSIENEKVRKLFILKEMPVLVEFYLKDDNFIELVFLNIIPSNDQILFVKNYIENWLDLKNDLQLFYNFATKDLILAPLVKKYFGLKLIGIPDFYEAICWAIIGQQINLSFAYAVKRNLVEKFGKSLEFEGELYYHFPEPKEMLLISNDDFLELKFSKQKVSYIRGVSQSLVDTVLNIDKLEQLDYPKAKKELTSIRGIGNWTADYVLMKTFRFPQAFPIQDAGLQNALKKSLKLQNKPDLETILQISKPWKGFESYATFYLWRSLTD